MDTTGKTCDGARTMNFLLAGLRGGTSYRASGIIFSDNGQARGKEITFATEITSDVQSPPHVLSTAPLPSVGTTLLASDGVATDLAGNQVWYNLNPLSNITRAESGGYFWGYIEDASVGAAYQMIRKIDLLGTTQLETNAAG